MGSVCTTRGDLITMIIAWVLSKMNCQVGWLMEFIRTKNAQDQGDPDDDVTSDHVLTKDVGDHVLIRSKYDWPSKFVRRRVNCVMVVSNMAEIYEAYKAGDNKPMEATRQLFCSSALRNCSKLASYLVKLYI